ncbi:MAG: hypothetical protein AAFQ19_15950 [Pseudomonadota bacterium]
MCFIWLVLVIMVALSASVSDVMDAGHMADIEHSHAAISDVADDLPGCCSEISERTQNCHGLPALLPSSHLHDAAPATCQDVFIAANLLLTGIEPSGPLDPPRAV